MSQERTTEILNRLSAISRDVGALRQPVAELNSRGTQLQERVLLDARVEGLASKRT